MPKEITSQFPENTGTELTLAMIGFAVSTLLTWWFINSYDGYISPEQMLLSGAIAGGKWAIQLVLAWLLLGDKKIRYFRELGTICAAGSVVLVPFALFSGGWTFFLASLIACVIVMAGLVCWRLPAIGLRSTWVALWFTLLAVAVTLQLTLVFRVY